MVSVLGNGCDIKGVVAVEDERLLGAAGGCMAGSAATAVVSVLGTGCDIEHVVAVESAGLSGAAGG